MCRQSELNEKGQGHAGKQDSCATEKVLADVDFRVKQQQTGGGGGLLGKEACRGGRADRPQTQREHKRRSGRGKLSTNVDKKAQGQTGTRDSEGR